MYPDHSHFVRGSYTNRLRRLPIVYRVGSRAWVWLVDAREHTSTRATKTYCVITAGYTKNISIVQKNFFKTRYFVLKLCVTPNITGSWYNPCTHTHKVIKRAMFFKNIVPKLGLSAGLFGALAYRLSSKICHTMDGENEVQNSRRKDGKFVKKASSANESISRSNLQRAREARKENLCLNVSSETATITTPEIVRKRSLFYYAWCVFLMCYFSTNHITSKQHNIGFHVYLLQLHPLNKEPIGSRIIDIDMMINDLKSCHSCMKGTNTCICFEFTTDYHTVLLYQ